MMIRSWVPGFVAGVLAAISGVPAAAQSPEPAVDTSAPRGGASPRASAPDSAPAPGSAPASAVAPDPARGPAATGAAQPSAPAPAARRPAGRAMDRVDLEASQITGNRELPRVLYIVPWRAPAAGDLEGRPVNSLLYELTKPVDRDVFRRENRYFDALAAAAAGSAPAAELPAASPRSSAEPPPEGSR